MPRLARSLALLTIVLTIAGCDATYMAAMEKMGYAKRDILSDRVKSARDAQEDAKKEIQSTLEQFGKVVAYEGGDLEATYKKLQRRTRDERRQRQSGPETDRRCRKCRRCTLLGVGTRTRPILQRRSAAQEPSKAYPNQRSLQRDAWQR